MKTGRTSTKADEQAGHVSIIGGQYLVDLGQSGRFRHHWVSKDKTCSCGVGNCEAIEVVRRYLRAGGRRAPDTGETPRCPICGGRSYRDPTWDGRHTRTLGWRCEKGGLSHFLEARAEKIRKQQAENPWLIPPVAGYPGVRRDELLTWVECEAINRRIYRESGYDPTR